MTDGTKPLKSGIGHLKNNAHPLWWRDAGLRKLTIGILVGFCGSVQTGELLAVHLLTLGYDGALIAGLLANPRFWIALGAPTTAKLGLIVASQTIGSLPGLIPAAILADLLGRRRAMAIGYLILIAGAMTLGFAGIQGPWYILGGRVIVGFGSVFTTIAGAPYTAEIAHPRNRPETTALIQTCFYVGSVLSAFVALGFLSVESDWSWRLPLLFQNVTPMIVLCLLPFAPESPRWLVAHDRSEDAHKMLAKYHANGDMDDELVLWELKEINKALEIEKKAKSVGYGEFFRTKGNRRRLFIILFVGFSAQWVGNGIITFYIVSILESVGITNPKDQTAYNGGLQIWNWFTAIGGGLVCERFGRRKMWLTSAIGQFFSYAVITLCSALYANGHQKAGYPVLASLFVYFFFYSIAFTPLLLAYPIEILRRLDPPLLHAHRHDAQHVRQPARPRGSRVEVLLCFPRHDRHRHRRHLLLLPRDPGPLARGDRGHLRRARCQGHGR